MIHLLYPVLPVSQLLSTCGIVVLIAKRQVVINKVRLQKESGGTPHCHSQRSLRYLQVPGLGSVISRL